MRRLWYPPLDRLPGVRRRRKVLGRLGRSCPGAWRELRERRASGMHNADRPPVAWFMPAYRETRQVAARAVRCRRRGDAVLQVPAVAREDAGATWCTARQRRSSRPRAVRPGAGELPMAVVVKPYVGATGYRWRLSCAFRWRGVRGWLLDAVKPASGGSPAQRASRLLRRSATGVRRGSLRRSAAIRRASASNAPVYAIAAPAQRFCRIIERGRRTARPLRRATRGSHRLISLHRNLKSRRIP